MTVPQLDPAAEARFETFGAHSQNWNDSAGLNPAAVKSFIAQEKERSRREAKKQTVFEVRRKTPYEKLPIKEGRYLVLSEVTNLGDKLMTGKHSKYLQVVNVDKYGEAYGSVIDFRKEDLRKLKVEGYLISLEALNTEEEHVS